MGNSRLAHAYHRLPAPGPPVTWAGSARWAEVAEEAAGGTAARRRDGRALTPGGRRRGEVRARGRRRAPRPVSRKQAGSGVAQGGPGDGGGPGPAPPSGPA